MEKRFAQRKTGKLIAAAVGAAGLAGFGTAQEAEAALIVDVRAISASSGVVVSADGKTVTAGGAGDVITFGVFARVTGTNGNQTDDTLTSFQGSFRSLGSLKGNMAGGVVAPFTSSSSNGSVLDFDSDGDLDLGSAGSATAGKFSPRAGTSTPTGADGIQVGQFTFTVTNASGVADIEFLRRDNGSGGNLGSAALWFEDNQGGAGTNPGTGTFASSGVPVRVEVPEPASLGLMAIAGIGMLKRRRNA